MSRVLITSIGNVKSENNEYKKTMYQNPKAPKETTYMTPYIAEAMKVMYDCDKMILFGTAGSDWLGLYLYITMEENKLKSSNAKPFDDDYSHKLEELKNKKNKGTLSLKSVKETLKPLIACIEGCADIILLKYGLNDDELDENFVLLQSISEHLKDGDELYFDITHAFRTLPIFELLVIQYLCKVLEKKVEIKMISYGMFEPGEEITPIVDVKRFIRILEHLEAASEYKRFGTLFGLLEINELSLEERTIKNLSNMSEWTSINNMEAMESFIDKCHQMKPPNSSLLATEEDLLIQHVYKDIAAHFPNKNDKMLMSIDLAQWHFDKRRYLYALIVLQESMITFCMEKNGHDINGHDINDYSKRKTMRNSIHSLGRKKNKLVDGYDWGALFNDLSEQRNNIAHASLNYGNSQPLITKVKDLIEGARRLYTEKYNCETNQQRLVSSIMKLSC